MCMSWSNYFIVDLQSVILYTSITLNNDLNIAHIHIYISFTSNIYILKQGVSVNIYYYITFNHFSSFIQNFVKKGDADAFPFN